MLLNKSNLPVSLFPVQNNQMMNYNYCYNTSGGIHAQCTSINYHACSAWLSPHILEPSSMTEEFFAYDVGSIYTT